MTDNIVSEERPRSKPRFKKKKKSRAACVIRRILLVLLTVILAVLAALLGVCTSWRRDRRKRRGTCS